MGQKTMVNIKVSWTCDCGLFGIGGNSASVYNHLSKSTFSFENFPWNVHVLIISGGQEIKTISDSLLPKQ